MRANAAVAVLVAVLTLSACGSSSSTSTVAPAQSTGSSTSTSASVPSTTPSTTTPSTTPTTTTSTTVPASGTPRCDAAGLAVSFLGQQGATGHGELGFALRNVSGQSCRTFGYPGVLFLDRAGQPLPTVSTRTTHDFFGVAPEVALTVAPGSSVSFRLGVTHGISSPAGCTTAYGLQVIAPDDTATMRVRIPEGAYECKTATVSPVRPGSSAYP